MNTPNDDTNAEIIRRIEKSSLFRTYRSAFRSATGLAVTLEPAGSGSGSHGHAHPVGGNPFCQLLNAGDQTCGECAKASRCLTADAREKMRSIECFAGLRETAIPVRIGKEVFAHLKTGQVFNHKPSRSDFRKLARALAVSGRTDKEIERLEKAYFETELIPEERYQGMVTLLAAFALQLAGLVNRIALERSEDEPSTVTTAREYIDAHLDEKLTLDHVAAHVNVSPFYFCKLFKQATGMTFTVYVNRRRVEWAKRRLLEPESRVTEVAYEVGYQSLSQFNRSFLKYAGESPTRYRERMRKQEDLVAA